MQPDASIYVNVSYIRTRTRTYIEGAIPKGHYFGTNITLAQKCCYPLLNNKGQHPQTQPGPTVFVTTRTKTSIVEKAQVGAAVGHI